MRRIYYRTGKHHKWEEVDYLEVRVELDKGHCELTVLKQA